MGLECRNGGHSRGFTWRGTAWRAYQSEVLLDQLNLYLCNLYFYLYLYLYLYLAAQLGVHIKVLLLNQLNLYL